jgi:hypothetical protein
MGMEMHWKQSSRTMLSQTEKGSSHLSIISGQIFISPQQEQETNQNMQRTTKLPKIVQKLCGDVEALRVSEGKAHQNQNRHLYVGRGMEEEANTRDEIKGRGRREPKGKRALGSWNSPFSRFRWGLRS